MIVGILAILSALALSLVSAVFSVTGIMTIFSGAAIAAGIMGGVLEASKITATVWLYHFWSKANLILKVYFFLAILILIVVSSVGIYGFLAKSYVGQEAEVSQTENRIERLSDRIEKEERRIERNNERLEQLDEAVDRYLEMDIVTRGLEAREEQEEERSTIREEIDEAEDHIDEYEDELLELRQERDRQEVDVGPVRYIAAAVYGEENAEQYYDRAARWLMLLLVLVIDPFAVLLMVGGNISLYHKSFRKTKRKSRKKPQAKPQAQPKKESTPSKQAPSKAVSNKPEESKVVVEPPAGEYSKADDAAKNSEPSSEPESDSKGPQENNTNPPKLHRRAKPIRKRKT